MRHSSKRGTRRAYTWRDPKTGKSREALVGGRAEKLLLDLMDGAVKAADYRQVISHVHQLRCLGLPIATTYTIDVRTGRRFRTYSLTTPLETAPNVAGRGSNL